MSISSRMWRSLAIPVIVAALSVPVADAAYRLAGLKPSDNLSGLYAGFGEGGYRLRQNVATSADWYSGPFSVFTDGLGLRCGSDPATGTPPGAVADYLVLGDSQGFGQCVDYEASVVGGFARLAAADGRRVANCSVGGHYLRNQLEVARWLHEHDRIAVERVVVLLTPYLIAAADGYNSVEVSEAGDLFEGEPTPVTQMALWAKTHTTIFGRVRNMVNNLRGLEADNSMLLGFFDGGERRAKRAAGLHAVFGEIAAWADSVDASLEIIYVPLAVELDFAGVAALAAGQGMKVDPAVPARLAAEIAAEHQLTLVDLRPALSGLVAAGKSVTCRGDPHYNPEASLACADLMWRTLGANPAD